MLLLLSSFTAFPFSSYLILNLPFPNLSKIFPSWLNYDCLLYILSGHPLSSHKQRVIKRTQFLPRKTTIHDNAVYQNHTFPPYFRWPLLKLVLTHSMAGTALLSGKHKDEWDGPWLQGTHSIKWMNVKRQLQPCEEHLTLEIRAVKAWTWVLISKWDGVREGFLRQVTFEVNLKSKGAIHCRRSEGMKSAWYVFKSSQSDQHTSNKNLMIEWRVNL